MARPHVAFNTEKEMVTATVNYADYEAVIILRNGKKTISKMTHPSIVGTSGEQISDYSVFLNHVQRTLAKF